MQQALALLEQAVFDLVICDMRMADGNGFDVMRALQSAGSHSAFLLLTAYASVPEAVRAVQGGAVDYLTKPLSFEHLLSVANRVIQARDEAAGQETCEGTGQGTRRGHGIVGRSRALLTALTRAEAAADTEADVLIEAESGTGKELLARLIHNASARSEGPFVAINCAALPESLLESELFGHARGAFTGATTAKPGKFEAANGGTLLLDEIGDMPLNLQPKLLRVLQERVVERLGESRPIRTNLRIVASTNVDLGQLVQRGLFRSDLFFRLHVIPLSLPPLRERMEDLPVLAQHFARCFAARQNQPAVRLHTSFLDRLKAYSWPGNVRELANFMQRVLSFADGAELTAACFDREHRPFHRRPMPEIVSRTTAPKTTISMDQMERTHLESTLELVGGNRTRAAEMLGISVRTMRNKIRQYDLPPRRYA